MKHKFCQKNRQIVDEKNEPYLSLCKRVCCCKKALNNFWTWSRLLVETFKDVRIVIGLQKKKKTATNTQRMKTSMSRFLRCACGADNLLLEAPRVPQSE